MYVLVHTILYFSRRVANKKAMTGLSISDSYCIALYSFSFIHKQSNIPYAMQGLNTTKELGEKYTFAINRKESNKIFSSSSNKQHQTSIFLPHLLLT
jgi:hypothetical protein